MAAESTAGQPVPSPSPVPAGQAFGAAPVGWVIAAMLVFWPTGIPALLASHRAARAFGAADAQTAQRESANARRWGIISVVVGACLILFSALAWVAAVALFVLAAHHVDGGLTWQEDRGRSNQQPFDRSGGLGLPQSSSHHG